MVAATLGKAVRDRDSAATTLCSLVWLSAANCRLIPQTVAVCRASSHTGSTLAREAAIVVCNRPGTVLVVASGLSGESFNALQVALQGKRAEIAV